MSNTCVLGEFGKTMALGSKRKFSKFLSIGFGRINRRAPKFKFRNRFKKIDKFERIS